MSIEHKINAIRQKPEHIRVRYVWGSVAISMIFILVLWFFSMKDTLDRAVAGASTQSETPTTENSQKESATNISDLKEIFGGGSANNIVPGTTNEIAQPAQPIN